MRNFKHLFAGAILALSISMLWAGLAFAAADDYTVSGGDVLAFPDVGDASVDLNNAITITDVGGDDFTNDPESISISINTSAYPSVVFDQDVTAISVAGTCNYDGHNPITYNSATSVTIPITGGTSCAAGQTIVIDSLKIKTTYATDAPGSAQALVLVDNATTSPNNAVASSSTVKLAVGVGDLTSTDVEPDVLEIYEFTNAVVTFVTSAEIDAGGQILVTFPSGFDVTAVKENLENCSGITCDNWDLSISGQVITLTENGSSATSAGTITFTLVDILTPDDEGSAGTYTILTKDSSGNSLETDASVSSDTIIYYQSYAGDFNEVTELTIADHEDGVIITWEDPTEDDTTEIDIFKGTDPYPIDGDAIATVPIGLEYYVDESVEEGDVVTYFLRSTNGVNSSDGTDEVTFTVGSGTTDDDSSDDSSDETTDNDDSSDDSSDDTTDDADSSDDTSDDDSSDETTDDDSTDDSSDDDETDEDETSFTDTEDHWAETEIEYMVSEGVIEGYEDDTFLPSANLNRAEAAALLYRIIMDVDPYDQEEMPFDDVELGEWYTGYIGFLADYDIVDGNPDGTYAPGDDINRAEFLQLAMNTYEYMNSVDVEDVEITDMFMDLDTEAWYAQVVSNGVDMGFIEGSSEDDGTYFNADDEITRAEATVILYRMFGE